MRCEVWSMSGVGDAFAKGRMIYGNFLSSYIVSWHFSHNFLISNYIDKMNRIERNSLVGRIAVKRQSTLNPKSKKFLGKNLCDVKTHWTIAVCVPGHFRVWHRNHAPNPLPSTISWRKREYSILQKLFSQETLCSWSPLSLSKSRGLHWLSLQTYTGKPCKYGHPYPI